MADLSDVRNTVLMLHVPNPSRDNEIPEREAALIYATEQRIREILLELELVALDPIGRRIYSIEVDTRNFANMAVEISVTKRGCE
jgi:hypothetical protein